MVGKMRSLEKQIATDEVDDSLAARQGVANALAEAVKSLIERKKFTRNYPLLSNSA